MRHGRDEAPLREAVAVAPRHVGGVPVSSRNTNRVEAEAGWYSERGAPRRPRASVEALHGASPRFTDFHSARRAIGCSEVDAISVAVSRSHSIGRAKIHDLSMVCDRQRTTWDHN
jgi:hypothetical protein